MPDKRKFSRFPVTETVICSRYGREVTMRTLDISLGGLKLEANFDLRVGESMIFSIFTNNTRINCKGKILKIEEFGNKVQARLCFAPPSDWEYGKLSDYLNGLSRRPFQRRVVGDPALLLRRALRRAMMKGGKWVKNIFDGREDEKLEQVNSWLELLPDMERTVITLRFGLDGEDPLTSESIGKRFGLPPERTRQIETEAIEKLRKISKKKEIYLDDII
ncbi:MAG: sigma factor-like helix-turn-helix DNA-binding protein [Thermodesulfobacteriota bacterium]